MEVNIIKRDIAKGTATIEFAHNGVTYKNDYDLAAIIPGTEMVLKAYGLEFGEEMQQKVIDRLTEQVQREIEEGIIENAPISPASAQSATTV